MGLEVYWVELAENKLKDIYVYYRQRVNKNFAKDLVKGIVVSAHKLEHQPFIGQKEPFLISRTEGFRYLVFKNYKIIYWVNDVKCRIEIVNVFDTRQNPEILNETP